MFRGTNPRWKAVAPMTQEEETEVFVAEPTEEEEEAEPKGKRKPKPEHDAAGNYIGKRRDA